MSEDYTAAGLVLMDGVPGAWVSGRREAEVLRMVIKAQPMAWQRAGKSGGRHYTPPAMASYQRMIGWEAVRQVGQRSLQGALAARMVFAATIPASWSRKRASEAESGLIRPTGTPDTDNLAKMVLDALQGVWFTDDAQIVSLTASKFYAAEPFTMIEVRQAGDDRNILTEALEWRHNAIA